MVVINNFFAAIAEILHLAIMLYIYVVIARVIISWFNINPYNQVVQLIYRITEPPLAWIRRYVPSIAGLDISPVILIFGLIFLDRFFVATLRFMAIH
jgi:YggT family protein